MQIASFLAASSKQAMIDLRANLGEDAIILCTRTFNDGQVSITGAVAGETANLFNILEPLDEPSSFEWLDALAEFHEWPLKTRDSMEPLLKNMKPAEPEFVLKTLLQAHFSFEELRHDTRKPILFSGPSGGGKTTTIAKLAANHVLAGGDVRVITIDTDRAGSFSRLTKLLAPLNIKPTPVSRPANLPAVVGACENCLVMIDSAGINPFDPEDLGKLSTLLTIVDAELLLVLPAGQGATDSAEISQCYAAMGAKAMVVTKLDAARRLGGILSAAEVGLAFTTAGIGPTIGDGLSKLTPEGMARLLFCRYRTSVGEEYGS